MATSNSSNNTTTEPSPLHQDLLPPTTNHLQVEEEEWLEDAVEVTESADVLEGNKILSSHINEELEGEGTDHSFNIINNNRMSTQNEAVLPHHASAPAKSDENSHERQQQGATEEPLPESAPSLTVDPTATETNDTTTIPYGDKYYQKDNKFQTKKKKGKPRINWLMHCGSLIFLALTVLIIFMLVRSLQTHNNENGESKSAIATNTTKSTLYFGNDNETASPTEVNSDDDEIDHFNETIHNNSEIPVSTEMPSTTSSPSQTTFTNTPTTGDEETFTEAPTTTANTTMEV